MRFVCFLESENLFVGLINHVSGKKRDTRPLSFNGHLKLATISKS